MLVIRYSSYYRGWIIYRGREMACPVVFVDEWEALDTLRGMDPASAEEMRRILTCC